MKRHEPIPKNHPVQPKRPSRCKDPVTCGTCGLTWDDAVVTSMTPAPAARCPFEYFHIYDDVDLMDEQNRNYFLAIGDLRR